MSLRELLSPTVLAAARLLRTRLTLSGLREPAERRARAATAAALGAISPVVPAGVRALVFSLRGGWYPHAAWEALIARGLELRGAEVHLFNCGGRMPICEVNFRQADPAVACAECAAYPRELARQFALSRSWLRDYVSEGDVQEIRAQVAALRREDYAGWTFDGQPVGQLVSNSVLWFIRKRSVTDDADYAAYRDFLIAGAQIARLAPRLLAATRPDVVLELNGLFFAESILNRFIPPGCRVITYEAGWRSNTLGFDDFSDRGFVDVDDAWAAVRDRSLTPEESHRLDAWMAGRQGGDMQRDFYVRFDAGDPEHPLGRLGLDPSKPTAVLFTNLVWDTAVLGRDEAFPSIEAWIRATVDRFRTNPSRQLVIRIHPAELLRPSQESREKIADLVRSLDLPPNVRVVPSSDPLSSYRLIDAAAAVLVYNSTVGLEAALRTRPVVVAARVYYARRGFTMEVPRIDSYGDVLDRAFEAGGLTPDQLDCARRFANLLLYRFLHDIPVVRQRPRTLPLLEPADVPLVAPGCGSDFDRLLERMLRNGPLVSSS